MRKLVVEDEQIMIAFTLCVFFKRCSKNKDLSKYEKIYFVGDDNFICDYLMTGVKLSNQKFNVYNSITYIKSGMESEYRNNTITSQNISTISIEDFLHIENSNNLVFFFVDTTDLDKKNQVFETLDKIQSVLSKTKNSRCVITTLLPKIEYFSNSVTSLSENQLNFYYKNVCKPNPEIDYYFNIEEICKNYITKNSLNLTLLRFDNVFAPDRFHTPSFDLQSLIQKCAENNEVVITDEDATYNSSITYIRDASYAVFHSAYKCEKGQVYNVSFENATKAKIKQLIFENYRDYFSLSKTISAGIKLDYNRLNSSKFCKMKIKKVVSFKDAIKHSVSFLTGYEYDTSDNVEFYSGKIKTIQSLEIETLKEIDRICVKHNIKYFLAGGSLLGAVRSGGSIPWDDDLDIGFLREEYEKFRKVCESELDDKFEFSSPFNGSGSHYTIEKVRLKSTYFSTNYSSKNIYPDGIFIDLLIYDQTSNCKLLRYLQTLVLAIIYDCIIVRWYNQARRNWHYHLTKFLLPILRIFPWCFYHGFFEFFVKLFKNKKNATLLIDSVGKKLKDGPLPKKGLEDTVYVDFDGIKAPIPVDYTGYLNYAYGPNYMNKPNLSNRRCPHNFARIDLGKYVFDVKGKKPFREVNLLGELYESENEI